MNDPQVIEQIHTAGKPLVLSLAGGGSGAIAALLEVPGGSAVVLEAVVPYSARALQEWFGGPIDHYCSERTARAMAMAAFERARHLSDTDPRALRGIGATASLASNRPKRGLHRVYVAWQSAEDTAVVCCELEKGARTCAEEENVATQLIVNAVAEACGVDAVAPALGTGDVITGRAQHAPQSWTELLLGERTYVAIPGAAADESPTILFPGAFNPIHSAHRRMAQIAAKRFGQPVTFEMSITNVDKPPLDFVETAERLRQFSKGRVLLTRAPHFVEKAEIAPGCTFVVGIDTIVRIGDSKYYDGGATQRDAAIATLAAAGCRFLVFGRKTESTFCSLSDANIPPALRTLCDEVCESEFREDVSSTELRNV